MPSQDSEHRRSRKAEPEQESTRVGLGSLHRSTRLPQQSDLNAVNEAEQQVQATYDELGNVGDKRGKQVTQDQLARGEVSRELREMHHGEIQSGPSKLVKHNRGSSETK